MLNLNPAFKLPLQVLLIYCELLFGNAIVTQTKGNLVSSRLWSLHLEIVDHICM
jgi:hypothetical protein